MTLPDQNNNQTPDISIPAATQQALEKVNATKSAWLESRRQQKAAAVNISTIRQRRVEMETSIDAQNEEWRALFRESQGVVSKEMKKLRTEIALGRETLEDFDELLAIHEKEAALLPLETAKLAGIYISAHHHLTEIRAKQLWKSFMQLHGKELIQTLSLLKHTMPREASATVGVLLSVNDPVTVLKEFIRQEITNPVLSNNQVPSDPVFEVVGASPDHLAQVDFSKRPSPAYLHKLKIRQEREELQKRNSDREDV